MTSPDHLPALVASAMFELSTKRKPEAPPSTKRVVASKQGNRCAYCQAEMNADNERSFAVDTLVPHVHLQHLDTNFVLSCTSCQRRKFFLDVLAWPEFKTRVSDEQQALLLARRLEVLQCAPNHLTPQRAMVPLPRLLEHLNKRWQHPRFQVYAIHLSPLSFIGWTAAGGAKEALGQAAGLLRFAAGATHQPGLDVNLFAVPEEQFLEAVWLLIEHHAWVVPVSVEGVEPVQVDPAEFKGYWPLAWSQLSLLRRRKLNWSDPEVPRAPRVLVDNGYFRERIRKAKRDGYKAQYFEAKAALNAHYAAIQARAYPPLPFPVKHQLEKDLFALSRRAFADPKSLEGMGHRPLVDPRDRLRSWIEDYIKEHLKR